MPKTDMKIFLTKKKKHQYRRESSTNFFKEGKEQKAEYLRSYYLAHTKNIF